ncbi:ankyrin repeat domain-containing protein [Candidatus Dependentiae bacterium]|nr:ankyrin repeat domain-containing protein [Candidatus Dependentiae bacterium]MBU4387107.1 ankyrin repeat domain-containing protein [Candidatus Dependentiae bacterium]
MKNIKKILLFLFIISNICSASKFTKELFDAADKGNTEALKVLIKNGADVNEKLSNGITPIMLASRNNHEKTVRALAESGAVLDAQDQTGKTALMYAASNGLTNIIQLLIEKKANLEIKDNEEQTALFRAIKYGFKDATKVLAENKANINIKNKENQTPLELSTNPTFIRNYPDTAYDIVTILTDAGAAIDKQFIDNLNETYMLSASKNIIIEGKIREEILKYLENALKNKSKEKNKEESKKESKEETDLVLSKFVFNENIEIDEKILNEMQSDFWKKIGNSLIIYFDDFSLSENYLFRMNEKSFKPLFEKELNIFQQNLSEKLSAYYQMDKIKEQNIISNNNEKNIAYGQIVHTDKNANIYFVGDIHGSLFHLTAVLRKLEKDGIIDKKFKIQKKEDKLIIGGDILDRGPFSIECSYLVMKLFNTNLNNVVILRGNHESDLTASTYGTSSEFLFKFNSIDRTSRKKSFQDTIAAFKLLPTTSFVILGTDDKSKVIQFAHGCIDKNFKFDKKNKNDIIMLYETTFIDDNDNPYIWADIVYNKENLTNKRGTKVQNLLIDQALEYGSINKIDLIAFGHMHADPNLNKYGYYNRDNKFIRHILYYPGAKDRIPSYVKISMNKLNLLNADCLPCS